MIAKIFHKLTSGSVYFKPYFHSSYTSIARFYGQLRKAIHPLTSYFHVMIPGKSVYWTIGVLLEGISIQRTARNKLLYIELTDECINTLH